MKKIQLLTIIILFVITGCTISYKFNGASIDYSKTKSIAISDFPNNAALVYPPLAIKFNEELRNKYSQQTRLKILESGGDLALEGSITGYSLVPIAVGSNNLASENRLTLTVQILFYNNVTGEETKNTFSANRTFPSTSSLNDVQDGLIEELIEEIIDQIFNATVANW